MTLLRKSTARLLLGALGTGFVLGGAVSMVTVAHSFVQFYAAGACIVAGALLLWLWRLQRPSQRTIQVVIRADATQLQASLRRAQEQINRLGRK